MVYESIQRDSEKNLRYFSEHKHAFNIEKTYPLVCFENFLQTQQDCSIDCGGKINHDQLYPARFTLGYRDKRYAQKQIKAALGFLSQVERRVEVNLNYELLQQFLLPRFDFSKVIKVLVGLDGRTEITDSRLKLFIWIEDYAEKVESSIKLCNTDQDIVRSLFGYKNNLLVGFDFYLDGRSFIELYPGLSQKHIWQFSVQEKLRKFLPDKAWTLLENCSALQIGFSQANDGRNLYFHAIDKNNFVYSLKNEMATRIHAYYQNQLVQNLVVCIPEYELMQPSIERLNMYYQMNMSQQIS